MKCLRSLSRCVARIGIACAIVLPQAAALAQDARPNVVFILADDLGWSDIACFGSEIHDTPNLDALAARGVRLTSAYANAPNCAPSRACLMSGLYGPRHGVYTVGSSARGKAANRRLIPTPNRTDLDEGFTTIAEVLRGAGYATAHVGKWHLGKDPRTQGFDVNIGGGPIGHPKSYFSPYKNPALADGVEGEYLTDRLTDEAIGFMREHADEPFFLYLPHYTVHTPIQGKTDLVEKYQERVGDDPRVKPAYAAMVESLDESVGRVIAALDELSLTDNTVVIFFSDNGGHGMYTDNVPLRGSKGMLHEGGIREPLIIAGPGVGRAGEAEDAPVIGTDLFPTMLELLGIERPAALKLDGLSIAAMLTAPAESSWQARPVFWHFPAYLEAYRRGENPWRTTPAGAVRLGKYKLIEFFEDGRLELYDLDEDISETHDLSRELPEVVATLHDRMRAWREATGAPVPSKPEPAFVGDDG
jgi:arylsulfatase A-like enzyme